MPLLPWLDGSMSTTSKRPAYPCAVILNSDIWFVRFSSRPRPFPQRHPIKRAFSSSRAVSKRINGACERTAFIGQRLSPRYCFSATAVPQSVPRRGGGGRRGVAVWAGRSERRWFAPSPWVMGRRKAFIARHAARAVGSCLRSALGRAGEEEGGWCPIQDGGAGISCSALNDFEGAGVPHSQGGCPARRRGAEPPASRRGSAEGSGGLCRNGASPAPFRFAEYRGGRAVCVELPAAAPRLSPGWSHHGFSPPPLLAARRGTCLEYIAALRAEGKGQAPSAAGWGGGRAGGGRAEGWWGLWVLGDAW